MASIHPHDTDRILAVLGEAIEKLREDAGITLPKDCLDLANDLALLHGAVSAEAQRHEALLAEVGTELGRRYGSKPIAVRPAPSARARFLSRESVREKLEADDLRGDFREDD